MSKQLFHSATVSTLAMAALALVMSFGDAPSGNAARGATAQGSLVSVLLRA